MTWLFGAIGTLVTNALGSLAVRSGFSAAYIIGALALVSVYVSLHQALAGGLSAVSAGSIPTEYGFGNWSGYIWMFVPSNLVPCISAIGSAMIAKWAFNMALGRLDTTAQISGR